jgi:hypothetical protein
MSKLTPFDVVSPLDATDPLGADPLGTDPLGADPFDVDPFDVDPFDAFLGTGTPLDPFLDRGVCGERSWLRLG